MFVYRSNQHRHCEDTFTNGIPCSDLCLKVKVKVAQLCLTLCDTMDYTVHAILQARILEWVAFPFSKGSSEPRTLTLQVNSLPAEPQGKPESTK